MRILNLTIDWSDLQLKTYMSFMKDLQYYLEWLNVLLLTLQYNVSHIHGQI